MASDKLDFAEVLAVLEAKRAALDALIGSFKAAISIGALGQTGDIDLAVTMPVQVHGTFNGRPFGPVDLPQGALLGMSLPQAIKTYLSAARRKQTTREITNALRENGVESTSRSFENTVATALHRLRQAGDVLKFNDGWALAELYPENLRRNLAAQNEKSAPKKARKRVAKKQAPEAKRALVLEGFDSIPKAS
jgi:hypothetical protein